MFDFQSLYLVFTLLGGVHEAIFIRIFFLLNMGGDFCLFQKAYLSLFTFYFLTECVLDTLVLFHICLRHFNIFNIVFNIFFRLDKYF